jgi:hypothetical protein
MLLMLFFVTLWYHFLETIHYIRVVSTLSFHHFFTFSHPFKSVIFQRSNLCADHGLSSNFHTFCSSKGACLGPFVEKGLSWPLSTLQTFCPTKGPVLMFVPLVSVFFQDGVCSSGGLACLCLPLILFDLHYDTTWGGHIHWVSAPSGTGTPLVTIIK